MLDKDDLKQIEDLMERQLKQLSDLMDTKLEVLATKFLAPQFEQIDKKFEQVDKS